MISLLDTLARIDRGETTPAAAVRACAERALALDGEIGAFVHLDEAARPERPGPLAGIAVGFKDIVDVAGMPTGMGSPVYEGWRPLADSAVAAAARRAGAAILGKTATTPFAYLDPAPTRNPAAPGHTPGGSSAGSAAAVAGGLVPLAVGTQTGGSVIRPASFCGVAGVKPSFRTIPTVGVKAFSWTLDTVGLFAATVADAAFGLAALTGRRELLPGGGDPGAPRLAVVTQDYAEAPDGDAAAALEAAARMAEEAGAGVVRRGLPGSFAAAFAIHQPLQDFEAAQALAWEYDRHRDRLPPNLRAALDAAQEITPEAYDEARRTAHRAREGMREAFDGVDAILTYSAPGAAPEGFASTGNARFNRLWTLLGVPCVNVPGLTNGKGHPVGIQVIAPFGRDRRALEAARWLEAAIGRS